MIKNMNYRAASAFVLGGFEPARVTQAASDLRETLGTPAALAFLFATPAFEAHLEELCDTLRVDGHITNIVGCTAPGLIGRGEEYESGEGFSVAAIAAEGFHPTLAALQGEGPHSARDFAGGSNGQSAESWIAILNPYLSNPEEWLANWGAPVVGGLMGGPEDSCHTHVNGKLCDAVAVGVGSPLRVVPFISQGCRPIGEPLTVTRAENNVVFNLGAHPAYNALQSAFETLTDEEKATARGNLFAGLAGTEYVENFGPDDFLIRNILGADPSSGAVAIGGLPRVGQTLQYQLRDAASADKLLRSALRRTAGEWGNPLLSISFACLGRGTGLFGHPGHDAVALQDGLGEHPSAGFFCNGEVAPVGTRSFVHSYSLASALIYPARLS